MIHIQGRINWDSSQNDMELKNLWSVHFWNFPLDFSWPLQPKPQKKQTVGKGDVTVMSFHRHLPLKQCIQFLCGQNNQALVQTAVRPELIALSL